MKHILLLFIMLCCHSVMSAQTSRRALEKYSTEAVKQIALTGKTPTIDVLDTLANNAEVSIEMLSRMGEPDDVRQQRACLRLIDDIVAYSQKPTGMKYVDVVRQGLKKSIDRSYEPDVQQHILEQLALVAKPNDAAHIATYLELEHLAPTATRILIGLPGIDDRLKEVAESNADIRPKMDVVFSARRGKAAGSTASGSGKPATTSTVAPTIAAKPAPMPIPFWTESLHREVESLSHQPSTTADSLIIMDDARKALPSLLRLAARRQGAERDAIVARFLMLADHAAQKSELTDAELYLLLRDADALVSSDVLRSQLIIALGKTATVQAFVYLGRYSGKVQYADAMAVAVSDFVAAHPELNRGKRVYGLLYGAKQSFIRHYDEQGVDEYIDQVLAAIDNWKADGAYNLSHTEETPMEKRGFWVIHDELADFDLAFDWKAKGLLTLSLRSMPVLKLDSQRGVWLEGSDEWHKFSTVSDWTTANISVVGDKVTVVVNGQPLISGASLRNPTAGAPANKSGNIKILSDDYGSTVRQYCFRKK